MNIPRRKALAIIPAAVAATTLPAIASAADQDPHPQWWREREEITEAWRAASDEADDAEEQRLIEIDHSLEDRIMLTPARTLAGLAVQAELLLEWQIDNSNRTAEEDVAALRSMASRLHELAGGAS